METDWCDHFAEGLIENGCQYLSIALMEGSQTLQKQVTSIASHLKFPLLAETTISEKIGYEVALAYSYGKKRSAFLTHGFSLPVAMDPLMSSIYTGVAGGFLILALDSTPALSYSSHCDPVSLAMFAKMPVLEISELSHLSSGIKRAFSLSEKYGTPVMLHIDTKIPSGHFPSQSKTGRKRRTEFEKNPARWAATPRFRFLLHKQLNQRLKDIAESDPRDLIHHMEGNNKKFGILCNYANKAIIEPWAREHDIPVLSVQMPFPLPVKPVMKFIDTVETVVVIEDRFPTIQFQLPQREKIRGRWTDPTFRTVSSWEEGNLIPSLETLRKAKELKIEPYPASNTPEMTGKTHEHLHALIKGVKSKTPSLTFVADMTPLTAGLPVDHFVSRGGAISIAAGFNHAGTSDSSPIIGITDSSAFLHYGIQATINAIYNTSHVRCLLLIRPEHTQIISAFLDGIKHVKTLPLNPSAKNAGKKLQEPTAHSVTFYTISMEESA